MTHEHAVDVTNFGDFRSAVFSQLKAGHGWSGIEEDLPNMNINGIELCAKFAWIAGECPFCSGSIIAGLAGLPIEDKHIRREY